MLIANRESFAVASRRRMVEVEYLESTGTQYIDALFSGYSTGARIEIKCRGSGSAAFVNVCGSNQGSGTAPMFYIRVRNSGTSPYSINYNATGYSGNVTSNVDHVVVAKFGNGTIDGTAYTQKGGTSAVNNNPFYLFTERGDSGTVRIYYCQLYNNGLLVRDFVPVRVGNVGYMYDRVSGQLLGNAGTGAFTIGPDKTS